MKRLILLFIVVSNHVVDESSSFIKKSPDKMVHVYVVQLANAWFSGATAAVVKISANVL